MARLSAVQSAPAHKKIRSPAKPFSSRSTLTSKSVDTLLSPVSEDVVAEAARQLADQGLSDAEVHHVTLAIRSTLLKSFEANIVNHRNVMVKNGMAEILELGSTPVHYGSSPVLPRTRNRRPGTTHLSTQEVAEKLNVSRPYVIKLCESGKLQVHETTEGGHRKILVTSVDKYKAEREAQRVLSRAGYVQASDEMLAKELEDLNKIKLEKKQSR